MIRIGHYSLGSLLALALVVSPAAHAVTKKKTAAAEKKAPSPATVALMDKLAAIQSFEANFAQTTEGKNKAPEQKKLFGGKKDNVVRGLIQVKRPGSFRWQVASPSSQLIVSKGEDVWVYDPDLKQASQHPLSKQLSNTPALLFSSNPSEVAKAYLIVKPIDAQDYFVLYPRDKESPFQHLSIGFQGNTPTVLAFTDVSGQQTKIRFDNQKLNPDISSKSFEFVPPVGVDVYTHQ